VPVGPGSVTYEGDSYKSRNSCGNLLERTGEQIVIGSLPAGHNDCLLECRLCLAGTPLVD
jgi:hypothetical protein